MLTFRNYSFLFILLVALTACGYRGSFVIENKTQKEVIIELIFDSINPVEVVANDIARRYYREEKYDSIFSYLNKIENRQLVINYFCDSLSIYSLLAKDYMRSFSIANLDKIKPSECYYYHDEDNRCIRFDQDLRGYYRYDSTFIKKIFDKSIVSIFLPPGYTFFQSCHTCGDCSCDAEFPLIGTPGRRTEQFYQNKNELRIVFGNDDYITLTEKNFRRIMASKKFDGHPGSYILELKDIGYHSY